MIAKSMRCLCNEVSSNNDVSCDNLNTYIVQQTLNLL